MTPKRSAANRGSPVPDWPGNGLTVYYWPETRAASRQFVAAAWKIVGGATSVASRLTYAPASLR